MADPRPDTTDPVIAPDADLGPYRLVRRIGEGGMGAVWEARRRDTDQRVAVKVLRDDYAHDQETSERFLREGRAAARVRHPHAVELLEVGSDGGVAYLVFEYLEGETLADRLAREGALPHAAVCGVMIPVLAAVAAAHRAGVVHRDLKPSNLFLVHVDGATHPKVLDFGISKLPRHADVATITETGTTLGTPAYMSPEQLRSARDAAVPSDVFSLGVVLYECATGRRPFAGETSVALFEAILGSRFTPANELAPALPPRFAAALRRALRPHPEERFALVDALARELLADAPSAMRARWENSFAVEGGVAEVATRGESLTTLPTIPAATLSSRRPASTSRVTALSVAALLTVGVGAWSWLSARPAPEVRVQPLAAAVVAPVAAPVAAPAAAPAVAPAEPVAAPVVVVPPVAEAAAPSERAHSSHSSRASRNPHDAGVVPVAVVSAPVDAGAPRARLPVGTNLMPF